MSRYFLLEYVVVDDYANRRVAFRELHLAYAADSMRRGVLLLGGALADPVDRAVLLFRGEDQKVAEEFARNDPYVINGLVISWAVREWSIVVGQEIFDLKNKNQSAR